MAAGCGFDPGSQGRQMMMIMPSARDQLSTWFALSMKEEKFWSIRLIDSLLSSAMLALGPIQTAQVFMDQKLRIR